MIYKNLLLSIVLLYFAAAGLIAQHRSADTSPGVETPGVGTPRVDAPSIAIRTDSERDSLLFRVRPGGQLRFRIYFEDWLQADIPPFQEKYYALKPQRAWRCVGIRETDESLDLIIFGDCQQAQGMKLIKLYKASDIPADPFI